jgi:hypothetical protein
MKKLLGLLLGLGFVVSLVSGCAGSGQQTYAPAAYGQNGQCYYVDSPAEAIALQNAGLCPRTWVPTLMPMAWHEMYYGFYDSPGYYNVYVPSRYRTVYVHHEVSFGRSYKSSISHLASRGTYKSSSGSTVTGKTILKGKSTFGSGTSFGTSGSKYGSGSLRSGTRSGSGSTGGYTSRTSTRSGGSSFGGGGLRSSSHR